MGSFGLGAGRLSADHSAGPLALLVEGSVRRDSSIWTGRYAGVGPSRGGGDVAFLYERILVQGDGLVSIGAGPGLLYRNSGVSSDLTGSETFEHVGLSWSVQGLLGGRGAAGAGVAVFGSIAGTRSLTGFAVMLRMGRLARS